MKPLYSSHDTERVLNTEENTYRSPFRRDNGRLIHSAVFRRLQGKTQLYPGYESDFFRNRLTHSLEVAQIAKGIAEKINATDRFFSGTNAIDTNLVETISLAHDLGHPPFGHNGEKALDDCMKQHGGFEGNAQTLRLLSKLEKKTTCKDDFIPVADDGSDNRCGLNLTYRTLAGILKYDTQINKKRDKTSSLQKGYYYTESEIVKAIRCHVLGPKSTRKLKTIECQIMDIADDIAYSTYDLEDAFKAEFLSPLGMLVKDPEFLEKVGVKVNKKLKRKKYTSADVNKVLLDIYGEIFLQDVISTAHKEHIKKLDDLIPLGAGYAYDFSNRICANGYYRTKHTSSLVNEFMTGLQVKSNKNQPALSTISLKPDILEKVEVLKNFTYEAVIMSSRLKVAEYRGYEIVKTIFDTLTKTEGGRNGFDLLPPDFRELYDRFKNESLRLRVICDFIAGMTDRYAVEFYARLKSENPQTIFKPL